MGYKQVTVDIEGESALLMHKQEPDALIKDANTPRKGTPAYIEYMANEWRKTAYWKDEIGLYIPTTVIEAMLKEAGKGDKENKRPVTKLIQSAYYGLKEEYSLGIPEKITSLDDIEKFGFIANHAVRIGMARVPRKRVCIPVWKCRVTGMVNTDLVSKQLFENLFNRAGEQVGIMDWRPKYGRFTVKNIKWAK